MVMAASVGTFQPGLGLLGLLARGYRGDPFVPGAGFAVGRKGNGGLLCCGICSFFLLCVHSNRLEPN